MQTIYTNEELKLARDIAETLNDWDSLPYHLQNARKYTEAHQRDILAKVMSLPDHKIRKTRAALYTFLINQGARNGGPRS